MASSLAVILRTMLYNTYSPVQLCKMLYDSVQLGKICTILYHSVKIDAIQYNAVPLL